MQRNRKQKWYDENKSRVKEYNKQYRDKNRSEKWLRDKIDYQLRKTYGITLDEYDEMLEQQGGVCRLCGSDTPSKRTGRFFVDHCHDTGKVRGLLCMRCNSAIGFLNDDPELLRKAIEYLEQ